MTNSYYEIRNIKENKNFDPYEILDITTSDELPAIKKSYRYSFFIKKFNFEISS